MLTYPVPSDSPFSLENSEAYQHWRVSKLDAYPAQASALVVKLEDAQSIRDSEYEAILARLRKTNMAIYATPAGSDADKGIPRRIAERFGLVHLDSNLLADDDGVTSITVSSEGEHPKYIPYTNRAISWHCDGYYNPEDRQIRGMLLHCVHQAAEGGENALLDHEIVYILMRDENPQYIRAMMQQDMMSIPPGRDSEGGERGASVGPVFSVDRRTGSLHMRYTARKRNIQWKDDPLSREAREWLERLLASDSPYIFRARLEPGMGLICNNVLHTREAFTNLPGQPRRLLYRARYFDRIKGT